jgi:hypothetical protein
MSASIFLSYPKPSFRRQEEFIARVQEYLRERGFAPRTVGVTDYDLEAPLMTVRRLMLESNGLLTIAFRRTFVETSMERRGTDIEGLREKEIKDHWLTSPWAQIEPAMAFQLGLPILIFREEGVHADGVLEQGVVGLYMPEFTLDKPMDKYFNSVEWKTIIQKWEGYVRAVINQKGRPPQVF